MTTYKERRSNTKVYVVLEGEVVIGVFSNLKKLTDYMQDKDFPSYSKLSKLKNRNVKHGKYSLFHEKLR